MNAKNLSILAIITLVLIIVAVLLTQSRTTTTQTQNQFFPDLMSVVDEITEITVRTKDETFTLIRGDKQWGLKEKHNYPVAVNKVHNLLGGVADLTILEAKTSKPALYSKIGVEDVSEKDANSTLVTFKKAEDEMVASLIVGNDRIAKTDSTRQEIYVRKPDEKQAWLTLGQLPVEKTITDWLDEQIVNLDKARIRQVSITHPDGDSVLIFKNTPDDDEFELKNLPGNAEIESPYTLRSIASALTNLNLDDVTVATEIEFEQKTSTHAIFTTFDGLEVTVTTREKEGKHYAKFVAVFNPEAVWVEPPKNEDETASSEQTQQENMEKKAKPTKEDIQNQIQKLNAKFDGWVYELSKYKVDDLDKKLYDLISIEEPEEEPEEQPVVGGVEEIGEIENLPIPFATPTTTTKTLIPVP